MAAFNHCRNMNDLALKPKLLRMLLREAVPGGKRPLDNHLEFSLVADTVRDYGLLSESYAEPADTKFVQSWKLAVDDWMDRILSLVSSDTPDNCWAGVCLLGLTCSECSTDRFLASYSVWFNELLSHIQSISSFQLVKVASCATTSDLLTRLGGFQSVKKDATSCAGRLVQPVLKILNEDRSTDEWDVAVRLLRTILSFFPASVSRHYDSFENTVVSRIISANCGSDLLKRLAHCLALLPKSRGDEESWRTMMKKILISMNAHLDDILDGLEEDSKRREIVDILIPPGSSPPPLLGSQMILDEKSDKVKKMSTHSRTPIVTTLMQSCCIMLTSTYPVEVTVPVHSILAIIRRVLMVDGSIPQSLQQFTTAWQQEFVCPQLPILHQHSLELLSYAVNGLGSQVWSHAPEIVQLLTPYSKKCIFPELRIKIYTIMRILLVSLGAGTSTHLAEYIISMAYADLNSTDCLGVETSSTVTSVPSTKSIMQSCQKKRKLTNAAVLSEANHNVPGFELETKYCSALISLKITSLQALEALLTMGGASKSDSWRSGVDTLLMTFAINCSRRGWSREGSNSSPQEPKGTWADLQYAALSALLASLLAPALVRPPHLSQGLRLFREGKQIAGPKIGEFCAHALLALEVLIHPRGFPQCNLQPSTTNAFGGSISKLQRSKDFSTPNENSPFSGMGLLDGLSGYSDYIFTENVEKDFEVPVVESWRTSLIDQNRTEAETFLKDQDLEKSMKIDNVHDLGHHQQQLFKKAKVSEGATNINDNMLIDSDQQSKGSAPELAQHDSGEVVTVVSHASISLDGEKEGGRALMGAAPSDAGNKEQVTSTGRDVLVSKERVVTPGDDSFLKLSEVVMDDDGDSSIDSFPRVIEGDVDSDGEEVSN